MKRSTFFKGLLALILAMTMCLPTLIGCTDSSKDTDDKNTETTTTKEPDTQKTPEYDGDFAKPTDSDEKVSEGNFIKVSEVDAAYAKVSGELILIKPTAPQMSIGGIINPSKNNNEYYRLDASKKSTYPSNVSTLATNTSGVTVRFRTNASYITLNATLRNAKTTYQHFTDRGAFGFDVYVGTGTNRVYCGQSLMTNASSLKGEKVTLPGGYQEVTINLPLYAGVSSLQIGFPKDAVIAPPTSRTYGTICFYGSSITQGGCASRPGNSYSNIICRMLNADNMNLGFSGSAKGEQSIAQYIASADIAAFVMDYDHNHTVEGLRETHYAFYETVRKAHPDIPIIMVTRPVYLEKQTADQLERRTIIKNSYNQAVKNGDENVYFIDGNDFFPKEMPDLYTIDMTHPNDLGMYYMAKTIFATLKPALEKSYPDAK